MPRIELTVTDITRSGVWPSAVTSNPTDDHLFANDGRVFLHVVNNDATNAHILTFITPGDVLGLAIADLSVSVAAGATRAIGPFPPATFNQQAGSDAGKVYLDVATTQLSLRALRL